MLIQRSFDMFSGKLKASNLQAYLRNRFRLPITYIFLFCLLVAVFKAYAGNQIYIIRKGDTLLKICEQYHLSKEAMLQANPHLKPDHLKIGQELVLPLPSKTAPKAKKKKNESQVVQPLQPVQKKTYKVVKGDTLAAIAKNYGITINQLKQVNKLSGNTIHVGQVLEIAAPVKVTHMVEAEENPGLKEQLVVPAGVKGGLIFIKPLEKQIRALKPWRRWQYIVVHHSGSKSGNARIFDYYHSHIRGMENGLAYHFVIGNGTDSGDGEIEVGPRWLKQIQGGHLASDEQNEVSIGICIVGDFSNTRPSRRQIAALIELIQYLQNHVPGKPPVFKLHREINVRPTQCPGNYFPASALHDLFG